MADRFGRQPLLFDGKGDHATDDFGGTLACNSEALIIWRVLQGVALAALVNFHQCVATRSTGKPRSAR